MKKSFYYAALTVIVFSAAVYGAANSKPAPPTPTANPIVQAILESNTAKAFKNQPVPDQMIDRILQCGIKAPSAMNQQPWHFTVIKNRELLDQMDADAPKPQMPPKGAQPGGPAQPKRHLFFRAPLVVLISATENSKFSTFDSALACENMSLAAQGMGLGTHIVAAMQLLFEGPKGNEYRKILRIPDGKRPLVAIAIGWPERTPDAVTGATTRNADVVTYIE